MKINEIFLGIDGEVNSLGGQGTWTVFVRTQGCNLRCSYCDTTRAQDRAKGKDMSVDQIVEEVVSSGCNKVTLTGGEPFIQRREEVRDLINALRDKERKISIETNGSLPLQRILSGVNYVADYKLPSSGMETYMNLGVFYALEENDYAKFVISDEVDFCRAKQVITDLSLLSTCRVAFSPNMDDLAPDVLMVWMARDKLFDIQLNIQIHKLIGVK